MGTPRSGYTLSNSRELVRLRVLRCWPGAHTGTEITLPRFLADRLCAMGMAEALAAADDVGTEAELPARKPSRRRRAPPAE